MIKSKLAEVNTSVNIEILDNGYTVEVSGRDDKGDWKSCRLYCADVEEVSRVLEETADLYEN
jgi:hypothetical protein